MWEKVGSVIMFVEIVGRVTMKCDTSAMCACIAEVACLQDEGAGVPSTTGWAGDTNTPSRNRPCGVNIISISGVADAQLNVARRDEPPGVISAPK